MKNRDMYKSLYRRRDEQQQGEKLKRAHRSLYVKRSSKNCQFFRFSWPVQIHVMLVTIATNYQLRGTKTQCHGNRKDPQILQNLSFWATMAGP